MGVSMSKKTAPKSEPIPQNEVIKESVLLSKCEFDELSELRYAVDGFFQMLDRLSGQKMDLCEVARC